MTLPGFDWLQRQLAGVDEVAGGYQNKMGNPMVGGAGSSMSCLYVIMWLLALVPMLLWVGARAVLRRRV